MLNERNVEPADDENVRFRFDEADEADERGEAAGETIIRTPIFTALKCVLMSPM